jgi:Domain of unknown function (DUF2017)
MPDGAFARSSSDAYVLRLGPDERALLSRLLDELRSMLVKPSEVGPQEAVTRRLFPVVHPDDPAMEDEYQHLMRDELVASRLAGINAVDAVLRRRGRKVSFNDEELVSFMQAVNSVRLVLGTLLDVSEDDDEVPADDAPLAPEHQLYGFLSWLLDSAVHAMSGT